MSALKNYQQNYGAFPQVRLRRPRRYQWSRDLMAETTLSVRDLIWPIFLREESLSAEVPSMPGVQRFALQELVDQVGPAVEYGLPLLCLFPALDVKRKNEKASEAFNEKGLLLEAVRQLKKAFPQVGVMTDAALDAYTSHGHDGLVVNGHVDNDKTVEALCRHALLQAKAGADIIGPSDMMDGRVGAIRTYLDEHGYDQVGIISYAAKYASAFYGPFRDALNSQACLKQGDKMTYQMDPANSDEALREAALDIQEGADMVMVKPGMPYLDVISRIKSTFKIPICAYQVSGEYTMIRVAADAGYLNYERTMMEALISFKRAGACAILTYAAPEVAARLKKG